MFNCFNLKATMNYSHKPSFEFSQSCQLSPFDNSSKPKNQTSKWDAPEQNREL